MRPKSFSTNWDDKLGRTRRKAPWSSWVRHLEPNSLTNDNGFGTGCRGIEPLSEERHSADFDALAHGGIGWGLRIVERAVPQKSRAPVRFRVVSLQ
jgi:hypothetical protein